MLHVMNTAVTRNDWVGRVIDGRFPLLEWLGNTEQAGVFRTELNGPRPERAVIRLVAAEDAEARLRDWKQAATLSHPHLMRIIDSGRADVGGVEMLYVVTEFADESLAQVIPERPLTSAEAREMLIPVVDALAHLHGRGLVHGHIKPTNIMVVDDHVKLPIDTLRRAGPIAPKSSLQIYDAPEVALGVLLPASDTWSLGVTLVEALTQQPPSWDRSTYREPAVPTELAEPFVGIARECLRYDAARRASVANVRALLDPPATQKEPVNEMDQAAPAAMTAHVPSGEKASTKTRLVAIGAAVLVGLAMIAYFLTRSHGPQPAAPVAPAPAPAVTPAPTQPPARPTAQPGSGIVKGEVAERAMPNVAASANRTIHGKVDVAVRVNVNKSGTVENAQLESRSQSRYFTAKALDAARKWTFKPAQQDGQAVPSVWTLRFRFTRGGPEVHAAQVSP
jgi:serine/threonine-protein kinase